MVSSQQRKRVKLYSSSPDRNEHSNSNNKTLVCHKKVPKTREIFQLLSGAIPTPSLTPPEFMPLQSGKTKNRMLYLHEIYRKWSKNTTTGLLKERCLKTCSLLALVGTGATGVGHSWICYAIQTGMFLLSKLGATKNPLINFWKDLESGIFLSFNWCGMMENLQHLCGSFWILDVSLPEKCICGW